MRQRILTGILAGILFLLFLYIGSVPFTLFIALIAALSYYELITMKGISIKGLPGAAGAVYVVLFALQQSFPGLGFGFSVAKLSIALVLFLFVLMIVQHKTYLFENTAHIFLSAFYIGFAFNLLIVIRSMSFWLPLFILIIIWSTDTGAYFVGRKWGRKKLSPVISPNKTVEGLIGGIIVSLIIAYLFVNLLHDHLFNGPFNMMLVTVVISVFGQLGDLCESAIKRYFGVKDSGSILPGHGGLLDRFDSLLFVMPVLFVFHLI